MLTLERLSFLMKSNVHRVDGNFPIDVEFYDGSHADVVDEGIDVYYRDDEGSDGNVWIDRIVGIDENGVIQCKDHHGEAVEVEIFQRVTKFDLMINGSNNGA